MSPGTSICWACSDFGGVMVQVVPSVRISAPKERSIRSVWSLDSAGSVTLVSPSAYKPARSTQDFYLGGGHRRIIMDGGQRFTVNNERRAAVSVFTLNVRMHHGKRCDDPLHGAGI